MSAPIRDVLDPTYCTSDPDTVAVQFMVKHTEIAADGSVAENRGLNSTHVLGRFPTAADAAQHVRRVLDGPWEHLHDG